MSAQVKCPTCSKLQVYSTQNPFRPFCSERCKTIDLGAWASESYRIAGAELIMDGDEPGRHEASQADQNAMPTKRQ
jgi:uncharacterized protein